MIQSLIVLSVLSCSIYYIGAYAQVTGWLRRWYPAFLEDLFRCSACSGFWIGGYLGLFMLPSEILQENPYLRMGVAFLMGGLWAMTTTPLLFRGVLECLTFLQRDLEESREEEEEKPFTGYTDALKAWSAREAAEERENREADLMERPYGSTVRSLGEDPLRLYEDEWLRSEMGGSFADPPKAQTPLDEMLSRVIVPGQISDWRAAAIAREQYQEQLDERRNREECPEEVK